MRMGCVASTARKARAEPWKLPRTVVGTPIRVEGVLDRAGRLRQRHVFRQVERDGRRDELRLVIDGERGLGRLVTREHRQRHLRAALGADVHLVQGVGRLPVLGRGLHHDVILVARRVDRRHLPLGEGVVQRRVDLPSASRRDAPRRRDRSPREVDSPLFCWSVLTSTSSGSSRERLADARLPGREVGEVVGLDRVLVRSVALPAADADVLHRREEEIRAGLARELPPQPRDDPVGAVVALGQRLQRDEHRSGVPLRAAGEADDVRHPGSARTIAMKSASFCRIAWKEMLWSAWMRPDELARVLLREEALRHDHVEVDVERDGRGRGSAP